MRRTLLMIVPLLAILALALWWMVSTWQAASDAPFSGADYVPLVLGVVLSVIIGCGLMALLFISSRRGYDEAAQGTQLPWAGRTDVRPPSTPQGNPPRTGPTPLNGDSRPTP